MHADVHLVEDVSPFSFGRDDVRRGQLLQVTCNYRPVLRQAIGDCGDVGASQQNELAENGDACRLAVP